MHLDEHGEPVWRDGDVVRVRFARKKSSDLTREYEYVRRDGHWPGESFWSTHGDTEMTAAWHEDRLSVMQLAEVTFVKAEAEWPSQQIEPGKNGVWIVYTASGAGEAGAYRNVAVFLDELEARRYADAPARQFPDTVVAYITFGTPLD